MSDPRSSSNISGVGGSSGERGLDWGDWAGTGEVEWGSRREETSFSSHPEVEVLSQLMGEHGARFF